MENILYATIVDDEEEAHQTIKELLKDLHLVKITHSFYSPTELLENIHKIRADVILLDIMFLNDALSGFDLVPILTALNKMIIFISGQNHLVVEACKRTGAVDVVPKPNTKDKLYDAIGKAWRTVISNKDEPDKKYGLFSVAGSDEKVSLLYSSFDYVQTASEGDVRNKDVIFTTGEKLTLMNCKFKRLLKDIPNLARTNFQQLINCDIVKSWHHDTIFLKPDIPDGIPKFLTLSRKYRRLFLLHF